MKGKDSFFLNVPIFYLLHVASRTCDLEAKQIKKKTNMQVSKFSSFRVYCRKRGKIDKLKISKASSWFSVLLLSLHFLFPVFFFLSLLFSLLFLLFFGGLVFYGKLVQFLRNFICTITVACGKNNSAVTFFKRLLYEDSYSMVQVRFRTFEDF